MINNFNANKKANYMSKDISREKDKLRLLWKEKRKKLSLNFQMNIRNILLKILKKPLVFLKTKLLLVTIP